MNKKNRRGVFRAFTACTLSAFMLLSSGCGSSSGNPNADEGGTIYVIGKQQLSFWDDVKKGAEDAGEEFGYDIVYRVASGDNDYSSQEADIIDAIRKKAKAIVIAPNGKTELNDVLKQAEDSGIKLIYINSRADYNPALSLVRCSDIESGSVAARNAIDLLKVDDPELKGLKNVAIIGHTAATAEDRISGFIDTFTNQAKDAIAPITSTENNEAKVESNRDAQVEAYKKGIIRGTQCAKRDKAKEEATKILEAHEGEISVIFGTNTNTTLGICDAVRDLDIPDSDIVVVGFNSDEEEVGYINSGLLDGTVVQNPYMMGYVGVRYAKKAISGDNLPTRLETGAVFVSQENINRDFVQLMLYPEKADEIANGGEG